MTTPKKETTVNRHKKVIERFDYYYNKRRLRSDDAIEQVADELCYSVATVKAIIKKP